VKIAVGASYQLSSQLSADIGYSHFFIEDAPINMGNTEHNIAAVRGTLVGEMEGGADIFSVALRYGFGGSQPAAAEPLVRKD